MIRVAEYKALSGATVRVTFNLDMAWRACGRRTIHLHQTGVDSLGQPIIEEDVTAQLLQVLMSVRSWNVRDCMPTMRTWCDRVPMDVAEGVATAIVMASAR